MSRRSNHNQNGNPKPRKSRRLSKKTELPPTPQNPRADTPPTPQRSPSDDSSMVPRLVMSPEASNAPSHRHSRSKRSRRSSRRSSKRAKSTPAKAKKPKKRQNNRGKARGPEYIPDLALHNKFFNKNTVAMEKVFARHCTQTMSANLLVTRNMRLRTMNGPLHFNFGRFFNHPNCSDAVCSECVI